MLSARWSRNPETARLSLRAAAPRRASLSKLKKLSRRRKAGKKAARKKQRRRQQHRKMAARKWTGKDHAAGVDAVAAAGADGIVLAIVELSAAEMAVRLNPRPGPNPPVKPGRNHARSSILKSVPSMAVPRVAARNMVVRSMAVQRVAGRNMVVRNTAVPSNAQSIRVPTISALSRFCCRANLFPNISRRVRSSQQALRRPDRK